MVSRVLQTHDKLTVEVEMSLSGRSERDFLPNQWQYCQKLLNRYVFMTKLT